MKNTRTHSHFIFCLTLFFINTVSAHPHSETSKETLKLQSYEPNTVGITHDDNDVSFMDFKISLKYPLFHDGKYNDNKWQKFDSLNPWFPMPYFAFTGRFGQYINTRDSSPVIGKRFNPKLFGRYWLGKENYIDVGYAHESNGQKIEQQSTYINLQNEFISNNENPDFANDYLSRGWDYWDLAWKHPFAFKSRNEEGDLSANSTSELSFYLNLKHFLKKGKLQQNSEEVNPWEPGFNDKQRRHVDGITLIGKYSTDYYNEKGERGFFSGHKIALIFTTGYRDILEHNTARAEYTWKFFDVPLMFWWSNGYNSDLIDYNQRIKSYGFSLELRSFLNNI